MQAAELKKKHPGDYDASKEMAIAGAKRHGHSEWPFLEQRNGLVAAVLARKANDGKISTAVTQAKFSPVAAK